VVLRLDGRLAVRDRPEVEAAHDADREGHDDGEDVYQDECDLRDVVRPVELFSLSERPGAVEFMIAHHVGRSRPQRLQDVREARYAEGNTGYDEVRHEHDEVALVVQADALVYPCVEFQRGFKEIERCYPHCNIMNKDRF
jgi:hypothetical protein